MDSRSKKLVDNPEDGYYIYAIYDGNNFIAIDQEDLMITIPKSFEIFNFYLPDYFNVFDYDNGEILMYLNLKGVKFTKNKKKGYLCFTFNGKNYYIYDVNEEGLNELEKRYKKMKLVPVFMNTETNDFGSINTFGDFTYTDDDEEDD